MCNILQRWWKGLNDKFRPTTPPKRPLTGTPKDDRQSGEVPIDIDSELKRRERGPKA